MAEETMGTAYAHRLLRRYFHICWATGHKVELPIVLTWLSVGAEIDEREARSDAA